MRSRDGRRQDRLSDLVAGEADRRSTRRVPRDGGVGEVPRRGGEPSRVRRDPRGRIGSRRDRGLRSDHTARPAGDRWVGGAGGGAPPRRTDGTPSRATVPPRHARAGPHARGVRAGRGGGRCGVDLAVDDGAGLRVEASPDRAARRRLTGGRDHRAAAAAASRAARRPRWRRPRRVRDDVPGIVPESARGSGHHRCLVGRGAGRDRRDRRGCRRRRRGTARVGGSLRRRARHRVLGLSARPDRPGRTGGDAAARRDRGRGGDLERDVVGDVVRRRTDQEHLLLAPRRIEREGLELGRGGRAVPLGRDRLCGVPGAGHEPDGAGRRTSWAARRGRRGVQAKRYRGRRLARRPPRSRSPA